MGIRGIEGSGLSEESKKNLQSETWQRVRGGMKEKREIKHFSEEADTGYGPEWGSVVNEYLKTSYQEGEKGCSLEVAGVVYRALRRDKVTAFYDSDGVTLFDVANGRLAKEYESLEKGGNPSEKEEPAIKEQKEHIEKGFPIPEENREQGNGEDIAEKIGRVEKADLVSTEISENAVDVKERAKKKLENELKNTKDKSFAEPIIIYLLGRCEEDKGLSEDVLQENKTWKRCFDYIYEQARKQETGNRAAVRDDVVYEWAEDYYHKDDKAEEEKKVKEAAERKKKQDERVQKAKTEHKKAETLKPKEELKPKKNSKDMDGQLDMFSMMGI